MIPGPPELFKCPSCDEILCRGSIMSGNTFMSRLFSDGKTIFSTQSNSLIVPSLNEILFNLNIILFKSLQLMGELFSLKW